MVVRRSGCLSQALLWIWSLQPRNVLKASSPPPMVLGFHKYVWQSSGFSKKGTVSTISSWESCRMASVHRVEYHAPSLCLQHSETNFGMTYVVPNVVSYIMFGHFSLPFVQQCPHHASWNRICWTSFDKLVLVFFCPFFVYSMTWGKQSASKLSRLRDHLNWPHVFSQTPKDCQGQ